MNMMMNEYEPYNLMELRDVPNVTSELSVEKTIRKYPSYRQSFIHPDGKKEFLGYKEGIKKVQKNSQTSMLDHKLVPKVDKENKEVTVYMVPIVESA